MKRIKSKKGSAVVLIMILFVSMTACISMILEASSRKAAVSMSEASLCNAGRIVLSAYDKDLYDRFGIMAYEYDDDAVEKSIKAIEKESFDNSSLLECSIEDLSIEKTAFSLSQPENLLLQIKEYMKLRAVAGGAAEIFSAFTEAKQSIHDKDNTEKRIEALEEAKEEAKKAQSESDDDSGEKVDFFTLERIHRNLKKTREDAKQESENASENIVLRNRRISGTLPSALAGYSRKSAYGGIGELVSNISGDGSFDSLSDDFLINEYIMQCFRNHNTGENDGSTLFENEAEYILYGNFSDAANYSSAKKAIFAIRFAANAAYLYADAEKRDATLAAAEALTPGPFVILTQMIMITAWSAVEASNDIKNLEKGNGVPLVKTDESWMTDLQGILNYVQGGYIEIRVNSAMTYQNYLRLLLMTEEKDARLYRIMDLIQINMKGIHRQEFIIADHYTGFTLDASVRKKSVSPFVPSGTVNVSMVHTYTAE